MKLSKTSSNTQHFYQEELKKLKEAGLWYATAPEEELMEVMRREPGLLRDWDDKYGDRMQKIVFIGQHLDKEQLVRDLDACFE